MTADGTTRENSQQMRTVCDDYQAADAIDGLIDEITRRRAASPVSDDDGFVEFLSVADGIHLVLADAVEDAGDPTNAFRLRSHVVERGRLPVGRLYQAAQRQECPVCRPFFFAYGCVGCNGRRWRHADDEPEPDPLLLLRAYWDRQESGGRADDLFDPTPTSILVGRDTPFAFPDIIEMPVDPPRSLRAAWSTRVLTGEDIAAAGEPSDDYVWHVGLMAGGVLLFAWPFRGPIRAGDRLGVSLDRPAGTARTDDG